MNGAIDHDFEFPIPNRQTRLQVSRKKTEVSFQQWEEKLLFFKNRPDIEDDDWHPHLSRITISELNL